MNIQKEIEQIIERAHGFWSDEFDAKNTANDWASYIIRYVAEGAYDGRTEVYTPERFREHLVKAAGLIVSAIDAIDRGKLAPRHYDR